MPELPEVETIARDLASKLRGRCITGVRLARSSPPVLDARSLPAKTVIKQTIRDVGRVGKFVILELGNDLFLTVHLRMTGALLYHNDGKPNERYTRAVLTLDNGACLVFTDIRKFGRLRVIRGDARQALGVGMEPFADALNAHTLGELAKGRTTPVKVWLLNQKFLAGVGNIYACESLFRAGLRPTKRVGKLTLREREALLVSLRQVLHEAIIHRGSSVDDYVDAEGKQGEFQKQLNVYGRAGMPCRRCGTRVKRIVLAQRGTFYCPACQG